MLRFHQRRGSFSSSTSSSFSSSSSVFSEFCQVCHCSPHSQKYGALACLACNAFFKRVVTSGRVKDCEDNSRCPVDLDTRSWCRSCRLQKCFDVGMKAEALKYRDKLGPRRVDKFRNIVQTSCFKNLIRIQKIQRLQHQRYGVYNSLVNHSGSFEIDRKSLKCATSTDIHLVVSLGFQNAIDWVNEFQSFRGISSLDRHRILGEFGIGYILIDQAFKTAREGNLGFWLLQNDKFLHLDSSLKFSWDEPNLNHADEQSRLHFDFVNGLLNSLSAPFQLLQIDYFECAILKTLLFLQLSEKTSTKTREKCFNELMIYSISKSLENGPVRFGQLILMISSIRCAIKMFYNHTKSSVLFNTSHFDFFVQNKLLS